MPEGAGINSEALQDWLRREVPGIEGDITLEKFAGGQSNPTYAVRADGVIRCVLRKQPDGELLPSAHAVDREYRVTRALAGTGFPVAQPIALCNDTSLIGTRFFVMSHVAGRIIWDMRLPGMAPAQRAETYRAMAQTLAQLHRVDPAAVGLEDFGRPGNYFSRQISRWIRQYRAAQTDTVAAMERLIEWLPDHVPDSDRSAIIHGDFRIDNLVFHPQRPDVVAVLDWELSTLGDPLADLAYHVMAWRLSPEDFRGLKGSDHTRLGIPQEADYLAHYREHAQLDAIDPQAWEFAIAYNLFRVACIRQGVLKRALDGNASSDNALVAGRRAGEMAELAWQQVQRIEALA